MQQRDNLGRIMDCGWNLQRKPHRKCIWPVIAYNVMLRSRAALKLWTNLSHLLLLLFWSLSARFFSRAPLCKQKVTCFVLLLETDEVDSEDSTEPPHKRLCLSEDDQSLDDSTPCISVVAVPSKLFYVCVLLKQVFLLVRIKILCIRTRMFCMFYLQMFLISSLPLRVLDVIAATCIYTVLAK